jgi:hypothetical protein
MQDDTVLVAFAGFVVLAGLGIAVWSYIRTLNAVAALIRQKRPAEWQANMQSEGIRVRRPAGWIYRQAIGFSTPDIADEDYKRLVAAARNRLLVCIALFVVFVIGIGWYTQGTMP